MVTCQASHIFFTRQLINKTKFTDLKAAIYVFYIDFVQNKHIYKRKNNTTSSLRGFYATTIRDFKLSIH
ncbi:hypothetical protein SAMN02745119_02776 [Trichlorobacter thiogenes]|uniref:Uncharacterized protein n=1 Tax=Trichlorobacter thiogenes TaxID=115783 RepID=A0A1T4RB96_9BACT|nr:hypothetical protein SAMN02745119_02776 [Trichlorobacter thiogenes]